MEFLAKFGIVSTFLFHSLTTDETRFMLTIVSGNNKVDTSVDAYNIADIRDITFFNIISNRDM